MRKEKKPQLKKPTKLLTAAHRESKRKGTDLVSGSWRWTVTSSLESGSGSRTEIQEVGLPFFAGISWERKGRTLTITLTLEVQLGSMGFVWRDLGVFTEQLWTSIAKTLSDFWREDSTFQREQRNWNSRSGWGIWKH